MCNLLLLWWWFSIPYPVKNFKCRITKCGEIAKSVKMTRNSTRESGWKRNLCNSPRCRKTSPKIVQFDHRRHMTVRWNRVLEVKAKWILNRENVNNWILIRKQLLKKSVKNVNVCQKIANTKQWIQNCFWVMRSHDWDKTQRDEKDGVVDKLWTPRNGIFGASL